MPRAAMALVLWLDTCAGAYARYQAGLEEKTKSNTGRILLENDKIELQIASTESPTESPSFHVTEKYLAKCYDEFGNYISCQTEKNDLDWWTYTLFVFCVGFFFFAIVFLCIKRRRYKQSLLDQGVIAPSSTYPYPPPQHHPLPPTLPAPLPPPNHQFPQYPPQYPTPEPQPNVSVVQ